MKSYEDKVRRELLFWKLKVSRQPSMTNRLAKGIQQRTNNLIPDRIHQVLTAAIKNMVKAVLFGSEFTADTPLQGLALQERERLVQGKTTSYKRIAAVSGAGTGAGGIFLGLADMPILLSLKMKYLFEVAGLYGFDVRDYKERIYILLIFQLAFSSQERSNQVFQQVSRWEQTVQELPADLNSFDWRTFQQEYRDYIDLAKRLQLVPVIGGVVEPVANYRLGDKPGGTAVNCYRMRLLSSK